ncbi:FAD-dependent oxidoreductase [soil metagenome]
MTQYPTITLLIVGGGHASLPLIKMGQKWKKHNIQIKVISAHPFLIYSGALPQYMGGFYEWDQTAINLEELCSRYAVPFTAGKVVSVDENRKTVTTSSGSLISYDYLLLNIGASTKPILEGENISPVKPMSKLLDLREEVKSGLVQNLLIIGGGAAGSELALNLSHPKSGYHLRITLVEKTGRILSSFSEKLSKQVTHILKSRGVSVITGNESTQDIIKDFDHTILAAGNQPGSVTLDHNFKTGESGRILTDDTLQVVDNAAVFAAGDTADIGGDNYQQIGVHAVKQGVLLRENLKSAILGKQLSAYKPYLFNPLILSNGPDLAFFVMGKLILSGRFYSVIKHVLDMRWMEKYKNVPGERKSDFKLFRDGFKRSR